MVGQPSHADPPKYFQKLRPACDGWLTIAHHQGVSYDTPPEFVLVSIVSSQVSKKTIGGLATLISIRLTVLASVRVHPPHTSAPVRPRVHSFPHLRTHSSPSAPFRPPCQRAAAHLRPRAHLSASVQAHRFIGFKCKYSICTGDPRTCVRIGTNSPILTLQKTISCLQRSFRFDCT